MVFYDSYKIFLVLIMKNGNDYNCKIIFYFELIDLIDFIFDNLFFPEYHKYCPLNCCFGNIIFNYLKTKKFLNGLNKHIINLEIVLN
jgi:hypothetical protein